jgi:organic radical activating enzyme
MFHASARLVKRVAQPVDRARRMGFNGCSRHRAMEDGMVSQRRLTHSQIDEIRRTRGRSTLLFITDRCPVGCAHCSVDSRTDSPTISDFELFGEIVDWICEQPGIEVVGISGGEPFVERRGLTLASQRFAQAGKRQVVYTSGVWARAATTPAWIRTVLERCDCVYLSTDAFHASRIDDARYVRAARAIADAGAWIVVQVLGIERMRERAEALLRAAFGSSFAAHAELAITMPVTNGRGASVFTQAQRIPGHAFGPCALATSPVLRYDGLVTGCCNESVIMDAGPQRLRRRARSARELQAAVDGFRSDPLLRAIAGAGLGTLTDHPRFADLADAHFGHNCQLCWKLLERSPDAAAPEPLLEAINALGPR